MPEFASSTVKESRTLLAEFRAARGEVVKAINEGRCPLRERTPKSKGKMQVFQDKLKFVREQVIDIVKKSETADIYAFKCTTKDAWCKKPENKGKDLEAEGHLVIPATRDGHLVDVVWMRKGHKDEWDAEIKESHAVEKRTRVVDDTSVLRDGQLDKQFKAAADKISANKNKKIKSIQEDDEERLQKLMHQEEEQDREEEAREKEDDKLQRREAGMDVSESEVESDSSEDDMDDGGLFDSMLGIALPAKKKVVAVKAKAKAAPQVSSGRKAVKPPAASMKPSVARESKDVNPIVSRTKPPASSKTPARSPTKSPVKKAVLVCDESEAGIDPEAYLKANGLDDLLRKIDTELSELSSASMQKMVTSEELDLGSKELADAIKATKQLATGMRSCHTDLVAFKWKIIKRVRIPQPVVDYLLSYINDVKHAWTLCGHMTSKFLDPLQAQQLLESAAKALPQFKTPPPFFTSRLYFARVIHMLELDELDRAEELIRGIPHPLACSDDKVKGCNMTIVEHSLTWNWKELTNDEDSSSNLDILNSTLKLLRMLKRITQKERAASRLNLGELKHLSTMIAAIDVTDSGLSEQEAAWSTLGALPRNGSHGLAALMVSSDVALKVRAACLTFRNERAKSEKASSFLADLLRCNLSFASGFSDDEEAQRTFAIFAGNVNKLRDLMTEETSAVFNSRLLHLMDQTASTASEIMEKYPAACCQLFGAIVKEHTDERLRDPPSNQLIAQWQVVSHMTQIGTALQELPKLVAASTCAEMTRHATIVLDSTRGVAKLGELASKCRMVHDLYRSAHIEEAGSMTLMQYTSGKDEIRKHLEELDVDLKDCLELPVSAFLKQLDDATMSNSVVKTMMQAVKKEVKTLCEIGAKDAAVVDREALTKAVNDIKGGKHRREQLLASFPWIADENRCMVNLSSLLCDVMSSCPTSIQSLHAHVKALANKPSPAAKDVKAALTFRFDQATLAAWRELAGNKGVVTCFLVASRVDAISFFAWLEANLAAAVKLGDARSAALEQETHDVILEGERLVDMIAHDGTAKTFLKKADEQFLKTVKACHKKTTSLAQTVEATYAIFHSGDASAVSSLHCAAGNLDGIIVRWGIWQTIHKGGKNLLNSKGQAHRDTLRTLKDEHFMEARADGDEDVAWLPVKEPFGQEFLKIVTGVIDQVAAPDLADVKWMVGSPLVHDPNNGDKAEPAPAASADADKEVGPSGAKDDTHLDISMADIEDAMEMEGGFIEDLEIDIADQPENDEPSQDGQQGKEQQEPKSGKAKQCKKATPPKKVNQAKGSPKAKGSAGKRPRFGLGKKMNK